ncbi:putative F-box protein At5g55150 [Rhodamnia argentea]|uniref:F-box protein At5g55150 n=1 Tax=Rhodamnia argentea TaxID=178133 RepID=A0ABM3HJE3_9MYRT|nr:putative F-box protein At5g55150 [Rhodamnia argentea]
MSVQQADWASLPGDIMDTILKKLGSFDEYFRVGRVCMSWFSFVKDHTEFKELSRKQAPLLVIPAINNRRDRRNLYSVIDGKTYGVQVILRYNRRCVGSSHGWLATVGRKMVITLTNPFSQRQIRLPPIFNPPKGDITKGNPHCFYLWVYKVIMSDDPDLCPENCVVGAIYSGFARLAFIKLGDECWTYVDMNLTLFTDIIFSRKLLHAVDRYGKLISVDLSIDSYVGENEVEVIVPRCMPRQSDFAYIVESRNGNILMVRRFLVKQPEHKDLYLTREIRVFKLKRNSSARSGWIEVKNLDGESLFVGDSHSTSLSSSEIPGVKPNCIYYTDDYFHDGHYHYKEDGPLDMGVFDMDNGSFGSHYVLDPSQKQFPPAIFITPSFSHNFP